MKATTKKKPVIKLTREQSERFIKALKNPAPPTPNKSKEI